MDVELNAKVYGLALSIAEFHGARHSILHAWEMPDQALLRARLKEDHVARLVGEHREAMENRFEEFLKRHGSGTDSEAAQLAKGSPAEIIGKFVRENSVDLVIMGTVARSELTGMFLRNTSEQIIGRIDCSLLAVKPYDFTTSISLKS